MKALSPPRLRHNVAALMSVQALGYLIPMITLPYVTRVLGATGWGSVAWTQVVIGYFILLTNWGFSWSGTRKIATLRGDVVALSETFFAVMFAQAALCLLAVAALFVSIAFLPAFHRYASYYLYGSGLIVANILFPIWFLNGLERMRQVATVQILTRIAGVPLIFMLIRKPEDAPVMLAIGSVTGICGGLFALLWIRTNVGLVWRLPGWQRILAELKEGGLLFGATAWIGLYTTLTPTVLGVVSGPAVVGYYALADRVRQLVQSVLRPISDALFPRMSHLFSTDAPGALRLLLRSCRIILPVAALGSMTLWIGADEIVAVLGGKQFLPSVVVLRWLAPLPLVIAASNILGVQVMIPNLRTRAFNGILALAGALSLCILYPLIHWKGAEGAAINTFVAECFVTSAMALYLWKTGFFAPIAAWLKR